MKSLQRTLVLFLLTVTTSLQADAPAKPAADLNAQLVALLESASVNSTSWAGNDKTWEEVLKERHLQANYAATRQAKVIGADGKATMSIRFDELLLPLPKQSNPAHILVRSNGKLLAFTKFSPEKLAQVVCDPSINLGSEERYARYCK